MKNYYILAVAACLATASRTNASGFSSHDGKWVAQNEIDNEEQQLIEHEFFVALNAPFDHQELKDLHDESHSKFRNWRSVQEMKIEAATDHDFSECKEQFLATMAENNLSVNTTSAFGDHYLVQGLLADISNLFENSTKWYNFTRGDGKQHSIIRAKMNSSEGVLAHLKESLKCVGFVGRITDFPIHKKSSIKIDESKLKRRKLKKRKRSSCPSLKKYKSGDYVTPKTIRNMYNVPKTQKKTQTHAIKQAVFEFTEASSQSGDSLAMQFSPKDLSCFEKGFHIGKASVAEVIPTTAASEVTSSDCSNNLNGCGEPNLDLQVLSSVNNVPIIYYALNDWSDLIMATSEADLPSVISISYGESEAYNNGFEYICTNVFGTLAKSGISIFVASGDQGAADASCSSYAPDFPSSCPYITAVGATSGYEQGQEVVSSLLNGDIITSGGGFSTIFTSKAGYDLSFQKSAVQSYLSQSDVVSKSVSNFNKKGRAYPDVSMAGSNYVIVDGGYAFPVSGTSASAPLFAGLVARAATEQTNGATTGFGLLNSFLYSNSDLFFDVQEGQNNCQNSDGTCCTKGSRIVGFTAASGYDPATGLGSLGTEKGYSSFKDALIKSTST